MYITQLEIDNFKSFARKTKIPFYEGFTVISGPNGSGKSNIIDSLLFCLALSSARGLRAEKLTDLINLNTGRNTAEVEITFSDGTRVRRRIKKTARGYYSYNYLNDRLCKQGDILDFLAKQGIKPEGYNVVMQGDITRIMEMSDTERRKIIDEIAGVTEFDKKRDQAMSELEVVRERIDREEILLHELNGRLTELRLEREQALKYREQQDRLEFFRSCRSAAELKECSRELNALGQLIGEQDRLLESKLEIRREREQDIATSKSRISDVEREINEKSGSEYLGLLTQLEEAKGAIKLAERSIERQKEAKKANQEVIQRIYMDTKRAETRVKENTETIRTLSIDRSNIAMEIATKNAEFESVQAKLEDESASIAGSKDELFELMKRAEEQKSRRSELLHNQDMLIEKSRMRTSERERLEQRLSQINEELAEKTRQCGEYAQCIEDLNGEKKHLEQEIAQTESQLFSHRNALERLTKQIRSQEQEVIRLEAQEQAAGISGNRALEAILGMDGVYGTIAQLGRAPPEYATALSVAAGSRLRFVVVESDAVAAGAIGYLKDNRLGRVTFLPLNKIRAVDLAPLRDKNVIDYAVNLLDYDPVFDTAFRQVFGSTVLVDSLDRARQMIGKYRLVTLEGDLIEKGGAMTGGSHRKKMAGFGVSVDDEVKKLRQEIAALAAEAAELEQVIARVGAVADELRKERSGLDEQMARYRMLQDEYGRRMESIREEKTSIQKSLEEISRDVKGGGDELAAIEAELEKVADSLAGLGEEIESIKKTLEDTRIPELSEQIERLKSEINENERRLRNKDADIADVQRERQHFKKRVEELEQEREQNEAKNKKIDEDIAADGQKIEENRALIRELEQRQQTFSKELDGLRAKRDELSEELLAAEKRLFECQSEADQIRLQISSLHERESVVLADLERLKQEAGDTETELSLQEIDEGISTAEKIIRKFGAVNMLAIDEYERVQKRVEERTGKKEVLSRERTLLIERIDKFETLKFESFMEAYTKIDENFRLIFARLTSGSGHLILDNEDDPFSGGMTFAVKPGEKKVRLLSALSGGEKSLTTLAFIFAIQQYMPAPFYALDEVDMFLDASNVERIATMIKDLSQGAQSIIVSLRKPTIERADQLVGVTLNPDKSTYVTGVKSNG